MSEDEFKPLPAPPDQVEADKIAQMLVRKLVHHDMLDKGCNLDDVEDVIFRAIEQVVSEKHTLLNIILTATTQYVERCRAEGVKP